MRREPLCLLSSLSYFRPATPWTGTKSSQSGVSVSWEPLSTRHSRPASAPRFSMPRGLRYKDVNSLCPLESSCPVNDLRPPTSNDCDTWSGAVHHAHQIRVGAVAALLASQRSAQQKNRSSRCCQAAGSRHQPISRSKATRTTVVRASTKKKRRAGHERRRLCLPLPLRLLVRYLAPSLHTYPAFPSLVRHLDIFVGTAKRAEAC